MQNDDDIKYTVFTVYTHRKSTHTLQHIIIVHSLLLVVLLVLLTNMTRHFDLFWEKYNAMRKSGKTSRHWTKDEYARVVQMVSDDTYSVRDEKYKSQWKLKQRYQVNYEVTQ